MMSQCTGYQYADGGTFQAVELPSKQNGLALVLLVPKKVDGLGALEGSLAAGRLAGWPG
jgi:serine protease inhibitor